MGKTQEGDPRQSDEPVLNIRLGRRAVIGGAVGGALGVLGLGYILGGRRGDPVPVYVVEPTLAPTPSRVATTRPSTGTATIRPYLRLEGKDVASPDSEGILVTAQAYTSLLFNSTPERVSEEYTQTKKDRWKQNPYWREDDLRQITGLMEYLKKCEAEVEGYNLIRSTTNNQTNVTASTGENSAYVTVSLDKICTNLQSTKAVINIGFGRDSAYGGTDPKKWKVFGFVW